MRPGTAGRIELTPLSIEEIHNEAVVLFEVQRRVEWRKLAVLVLILVGLLVALGYVTRSISATTVEGVQLVQTLGGLAFLGIMILFVVGAYFYRPPSLRLQLTARLAAIELEIRRMLTATGEATRTKAISAIIRKCQAMLQVIPGLPFGKLDFYLERHREFVKTISNAIKRLMWLAKRRNTSAISEHTVDTLDDLVRGMWINSLKLTDEVDQSADRFLDSLGGALPSRWTALIDLVWNPSIRNVALIALFLLLALGISLALVLPAALLLGAPPQTALVPAGPMAAAIFAALYFGWRQRQK